MFGDLRSGNWVTSVSGRHELRRIDRTHACQVMHIRAYDGQVRNDVVSPRSFLELRKDQEGQKERADDIDGDGAFVPTNLVEVQGAFPGILDDRIESLQSLDSLRERFYIVVVFKVEIPDFNNAFPRSGLLDVFGGSFALGSSARGNDYSVSVQADKVARGFLSKTCVCASDDDRAAGTVGLWKFWRCEGLVVQTLTERTHRFEE